MNKRGKKPIEEQQQKNDYQQKDDSPLFAFVQAEKATNPVLKLITHDE